MSVSPRFDPSTKGDFQIADEGKAGARKEDSTSHALCMGKVEACLSR